MEIIKDANERMKRDVVFKEKPKTDQDLSQDGVDESVRKIQRLKTSKKQEKKSQNEP